MGLLEDYAEAGNVLFQNKIVAALSKSCLGCITNITDADPLYYEKLAMCREASGSVGGDMLWLARFLVAQGYTNASQETAIQSYIDAAFDKIALLFVYKTVGGTG